MRNDHRWKTGSVLIMTLWALSFLTFFVTSLGLGVRQKTVVLQRLEHRSRLRNIAESAVWRMIAFFYNETILIPGARPAQTKQFRFNNSDLFKGLSVDQGKFDAMNRQYRSDGSLSATLFGLVDEERKININHADRKTLTRLVQYTAALSEEDAKRVADAIYDWRVYGDSEIVGFLSDEYYSNLRWPYEEKKAAFENPAELLLVKQISRHVYERLQEFLTVYGDGRVNVNTAQAPVLKALGMSDNIVNAILMVRAGPDGREATADDFVFQDVQSLAPAVTQIAELTNEESDALAGLESKLGVNSFFYSIQGVAQLDSSTETRQLTCTFDSRAGQIVYWQE